MLHESRRNHTYINLASTSYISNYPKAWMDAVMLPTLVRWTHLFSYFYTAHTAVVVLLQQCYNFMF